MRTQDIFSATLSILIIILLLAQTYPALAQEDTVRTYVKIQVDGLSCPFCAYGLERNVEKVNGAKDIFISIKEGYTTFNIPKDQLPTEDELIKVVKNAGFTARKVIFSEKPFDTNDR